MLTSCGDGEISWEDPAFGHGVFMHFMLEALSGKADSNGDGSITLDEVCRYASAETKAFVKNTYNSLQLPKLHAKELSYDSLDFVLACPAGNKAHPKLITNSIGMKLALIPAGEFVMGSPETELDEFVANDPDFYGLITMKHNADEKQHRVQVDKPFYMGVYEVTQAEYLAVMGENPSSHSAAGHLRESVRGLDTSRFPVDSVSWDERRRILPSAGRERWKALRVAD